MSRCDSPRCPLCIALGLEPPEGVDKWSRDYRAQRALQRMVGGETVRLPEAVVQRFPMHLKPDVVTPTPRTGAKFWTLDPSKWGEVLPTLLFAGWR